MRQGSGFHIGGGHLRQSGASNAQRFRLFSQMQAEIKRGKKITHAIRRFGRARRFATQYLIGGHRQSGNALGSGRGGCDDHMRDAQIARRIDRFDLIGKAVASGQPLQFI